MEDHAELRLTLPERLQVGIGANARTLACRRRHGVPDRSGVVWLGGFRSDMMATKAGALDAWSERTGRAFLRFDYSGHGESSGRFEDGTISRWLDDTLAVLAACTVGPQVLVGSSMGAWLALLVTQRLVAEGKPPAGLVLIAPAVDFTERLMWAELDEAARRAVMEEGVYLRPSPYSPEPVPITRALIEDGRTHLMLDGLIRSFAPVHILQGMRDEDVPWRYALALTEHFPGDPVVVTLIKDGDHRLSRPEDIARIVAAVAAIA